MQQAYIEGVSTRKVDTLLQALGSDGHRQEPGVAHLQGFDGTGRVSQPAAGAYPYVWLDALYVKVRQNHRIVWQAVVLAIGVRETGERELLGFANGASEEAAFWVELPARLVGGACRGCNW